MSGHAPSVLPDISPSRGEIGSVELGPLLFCAGDWRNPARWLISPLEGEMSGRTEGGAWGDYSLLRLCRFHTAGEWETRRDG